MLNPRGPAEGSSVEDMKELPPDEANSSRTVQLGTSLNPEQRSEVLAFLRLNVDLDHKLVKQKRRPFDTERYKDKADEVSTLFDAGFIKKIAMHPLDKQKTIFITDKGLYCYRVMPFGLKNIGVTYQRLVNQMFAKQIGHIMEVYVNDMLVKNVRAANHLTDLRETFTILREY
ncbi:uncharacterized protein LOC131255146 [Magnolia sinica]|uniref:uncharacterized protein LOC131255146 n=1 Tax=Magnolia sinica TaxID=86752 RepID=UPI002659BE89|nr:uncharacterized protein LOC131255146 [Magnolia sinica]